MNQSNKFALITGASSGIGWHISRELALRGYGILAVSNQPEQLDQLKTMLEHDFSVPVITREQDLARQEAATELFTYCTAHNISVEVLVNNAGMLLMGETVELSPEKSAGLMNLHMHTSTLLAQLFGQLMQKNRRGFILNVASIASVMPYPTISLYGPSKTYLRYFSRALRIEMKPYNVFVCCLLPGATETKLYEVQNINVNLFRKAGIMKDPAPVAHAGITALFNNRAERIPGILNKLIIVFVPWIPYFVVSWINRWRIRRK